MIQQKKRAQRTRHSRHDAERLTKNDTKHHHGKSACLLLSIGNCPFLSVKPCPLCLKASVNLRHHSVSPQCLYASVYLHTCVSESSRT